ncbi:MAG: hypothetical protein KC944_10130 [Candidatus Omnitrophica bacterium]|nr:hypothetical protein [Candidatus Omnitrophota bacterium]
MKTLKTTFAAAIVAFTLFAFAGADQAQAGWKKNFKGGFRTGHVDFHFGGHGHGHHHGHFDRVWIPGYYIGHGCHRHWVPGHWDYIYHR